jgi:hypothetical protein
VRLLPPLIIDDAQAAQIVDGVSELIADFVRADLAEATEK